MVNPWKTKKGGKKKKKRKKPKTKQQNKQIKKAKQRQTTTTTTNTNQPNKQTRKLWDEELKLVKNWDDWALAGPTKWGDSL